MVLVPACIELAEGWQPVRDDAMISIGAYRVFSLQSPLVGNWSQASEGMRQAFFDLGPLLFWFLAVPVRLDPDQGALWGAALICGAALSVAVEAAWSVKGWPAAVAMALLVADMGWQNQLLNDLAWNPRFGLVFLIAAGASAWAVASGRFGWWPLVVLGASVAAQCHLVYAITAIGLVVVAPLAALVYGHRPPRWRWLVVGLVLGAACWVAPLIQQVTGHPGNLSTVLHSGTAQASVGLGFGWHALATAVTLHPIWLTQFPYLISFADQMPHYLRGHAEAGGFVGLGLTVGIAVAAWRAKRGELSALAVIGVVMAVGTVASFATFPRDNLGPVGYLSYVLWLVGILVWIIVVWAAGDLLVSGFRWWRGRRHLRGWVPIRFGLAVAALLLMVIAGVAALKTMVPEAHQLDANLKVDARLDHAIARSVEHTVPPGPVIVVVRPSTFGAHYGYYVIDYWGVALLLLEHGWRPGLQYTFSGVATHLTVPPGARWPEVIVHVDLATKAVIGAQRVGRTDGRG